jgi:regulator of cell morphogenesis and NO signaling
MIQTTKSVGELAAEIPGATRVFTKLGIDYCCGGKQSLADACAAVHYSVEDAAAQLETAAHTPSNAAERDWNTAPLAEIVTYIIEKHHAFTRDQLAILGALMTKVHAAHSANHPELSEVARTLQNISQELSMHMMKEEQILFPYIVEMDQALQSKKPVQAPMFGTVENPIRMMMLEHDSAGNELQTLRTLSNGYSVPADGCASYRSLYQELEALETDLHAHIHLENNILFPRAIRMESEAL